MHVLRDYNNVPAEWQGAALAIGNFDGVHRGHQVILAAAREVAAKAGCKAGAIVFEPQPAEFFRPGETMLRITPLPEKLRLLAAVGLDLAVVLTFDHQLAGLTAETFIGDVLKRGLRARHLVVGYDFHFGRKRGGNVETLRSHVADGGYQLTVIAPQTHGDAAPGKFSRVYSSTEIRKCLADGNVRAAAELMGHWWRVEGVVVGGDRRGTGLGFPTANIRLFSRQMFGHGIYAARVLADNVWHGAAAYLGTRPTFDNGAPVLEVFLFEFSGDLYGKTIAVELIERLRGDEAFTTVEALKIRMRQDCDRARAVLTEIDGGNPFDETAIAGAAFAPIVEARL